VSRTAAVLAVLAVLVLTACGSNDSGGSTGSGKGAATNPATTAQASKPAASAPANKTVVARCHQAFDPFIAELRQINSDVAATPNYTAYSAATRKLKSDYVKFDVAAIPSPSCQSAIGAPAAGAYALHVTASETWAKCTKRQSCSATLVKLKQQWRKASRLTEAADKAFDTVTAA
jgi:ABC-type branched-subunit amino acid transport system substrate-binding protein